MPRSSSSLQCHTHPVSAIPASGYLGAIALNAIRGNRPFLRRNALIRTGGFLAAAIVGSISTVTIATFGVHAFASGQYWTLFGLGVLTMFALAMATSAVISVLGSLGTPLVLVASVILGTPAADATVPIQLTGSGPWHALTNILPTGVAVRAIRSGVYFSGIHISQYSRLEVADRARLIAGNSGAGMAWLRARQACTGPPPMPVGDAEPAWRPLLGNGRRPTPQRDRRATAGRPCLRSLRCAHRRRGGGRVTVRQDCVSIRA